MTALSSFERISIQGDRRLLSVSLDMRPLAVMIGANGVGKTSFLDVFRLLSASAKNQLQDQISDDGGLGEVLTSGKAQN